MKVASKKVSPYAQGSDGLASTNCDVLDSGSKPVAVVETVNGIDRTADPISHSAANLRLGATDGVARRGAIDKHRSDKENRDPGSKRRTFKEMLQHKK